MFVTEPGEMAVRRENVELFGQPPVGDASSVVPAAAVQTPHMLPQRVERAMAGLPGGAQFPDAELAKGPIGPIVTAHPGLAGPARPNLLFGQVQVAWVHLGAGGEDRLAVAILAGEGLRSRRAGRYPRQICGCSRMIWSTAGRMNIGAGDGDMD